MTKKKITRKVSWTISLGALFYITIKFLIGKADTFSTICMFVCYSLWALYLIPSIVLKITQNIQKYEIYKSLITVFEYFQAIHKERYKLYFTGDNRKKIEEYSAEIEEYGNAILDVCEEIITKNLLSKKHTKNVEKILNQTKKLMSTTN